MTNNRWFLLSLSLLILIPLNVYANDRCNSASTVQLKAGNRTEINVQYSGATLEDTGELPSCLSDPLVTYQADRWFKFRPDEDGTLVYRHLAGGSILYSDGDSCPPRKLADCGTFETEGRVAARFEPLKANQSYLLRMLQTSAVSDSPTVDLGFYSSRAPTNDACEKAVDITDNLRQSRSFHNGSATTDGDLSPPSCGLDGGSALGRDIWYEFEADFTGMATISMDDLWPPNPIAYLTVYEDSDHNSCPPRSSRQVACGKEMTEVEVTKGKRYLIRVSAQGTRSQNPNVPGAFFFERLTTVFGNLQVRTENDDRSPVIAVDQNTIPGHDDPDEERGGGLEVTSRQGVLQTFRVGADGTLVDITLPVRLHRSRPAADLNFSLVTLDAQGKPKDVLARASRAASQLSFRLDEWVISVESKNIKAEAGDLLGLHLTSSATPGQGTYAWQGLPRDRYPRGSAFIDTSAGIFKIGYDMSFRTRIELGDNSVIAQ